MTLNAKGLNFFGTIFMGDVTVVKVEHVGSMNEKGHILVNLGQI